MVKISITDFLVEFTNKGRYEVFKAIFNSKKRHSEIEKELDLPGPEVSRNIKRLINKGLVKKRINGEYEMTSIGVIIHEILKFFEKLLNIKDFINNHEIISIPLNLILQLGKTDSVQFEDHTMVNIQKWADLVSSSEEYIIAISDQFQDSILPIIEKKIQNHQIEIRTIIDITLLNDSVKIGKIFQDRHNFYDKMDAFHNVRVINQMNLSLLGTEKGAILFLSKDGKVDYSQCLYDNTKSFIEWIKELFNWYWRNSADLKAFL